MRIKTAEKQYMSMEIKAFGPMGGEPSLQQIQSIYHSITGKTESINRLFFDFHIIRIEDFDHLHSLIEQTLEQYDCKGLVFNGIVRYADGKSDRFSSFEKLKSFGSSRGYATVEIELEYNFLIKPPQYQEFKPYTLTIGCRNGIGILESFKLQRATDAEQRMYFDFQSGTARLELEYVDLAVARTFEACIEDWYHAIQKQSDSWLVKLGKKSSPYIGVAIQINMFVAASICMYYLFSARDFGQGNYNFIFRFITVNFFIFFSLLCISMPIRVLVEKSLSRAKVQPVIIFTARDSLLFLDYNKNSLRPIWTILISQSISIISGLVVAFLAGYMGI